MIESEAKIGQRAEDQVTPKTARIYYAGTVEERADASIAHRGWTIIGDKYDGHSVIQLKVPDDLKAVSLRGDGYIYGPLIREYIVFDPNVVDVVSLYYYENQKFPEQRDRLIDDGYRQIHSDRSYVAYAKTVNHETTP